mgnify:CR=1 FL=1
MKISAKGQCLCGAVSVAGQVEQKVGVCHCSMCRQWVGGPFLAVDAGTELTITGEQNVERFSSSDWAERAFCKKCGSALFYRLKQNNQHIVSAGLFGVSSDFTLDHQIFIDEKPHYYSFANQTHNMTGAEVFAQFAPKE